MISFHQTAMRAVSFCTLVLGAVALLVTGAATIGTNLEQPPVSGRPRAVASPLPWLPVSVVGGAPATITGSHGFAPSSDQGKPFAPNDNQCAPDESVIASPEAFELTEPVRIDFSRLCTEASHLDIALHLNRKP